MEEQISVRKNYFYNTVTMAVNGAFALFSLPYVARVLGPEGIGKVGFAASIAQYFVMIAGFGLPLYGVREIAKARDDQGRLNKVFSELFLISLVASLISLALYLCLFMVAEKIRNEGALFIIFGVQVAFNMFSIEWLYQGLERYRYIMVRNAVVKAMTLCLIFIIVRAQKDYAAFAALAVFAVCGGSVWNILASSRGAHFTAQGIDVMKHVKALKMFYGAALIGCASSTLDTAMLGFFSKEANVGYFTLDKRLIAMVLGFIAAFGAVTVPRLSYHLEKDRREDYRRLAERSVRVICCFSLPIMAALAMLSPEIMTVVGGAGFRPGSLSLTLFAPTVLITSLNVFFAFQVLVPHHQERGMVIANLAGALVSLTLNLTLIPRYHHNAAALSTTVSETLVLMILMLLAGRCIPLKGLVRKDLVNYVYGSVLVGMSIAAVKLVVSGAVHVVVGSFIVSSLVYVAYLFFRRDSCIVSLRSIIKPAIMQRSDK